MKSNFEVTVTPPGSDAFVMVEAAIGTQSVGPNTGDPLNMTDPGPIRLMVIEGSVAARVTFTDPTFAAAVRDALDRALKVSDTRDYTLDRRRP